MQILNILNYKLPSQLLFQTQFLNDKIYKNSS